jgi:hypothetical protein
LLVLRSAQRAAMRGYAVAASAASLEAGFDNRVPAQTIVFKWTGDDREMEVIEARREENFCSAIWRRARR